MFFSSQFLKQFDSFRKIIGFLLTLGKTIVFSLFILLILFFLYFQISALFEEVARLRQAISNIQESHNLQIQRLEDRLEEKRQTIVRLESRIEKSAEYDDIKKENR